MRAAPALSSAMELVWAGASGCRWLPVNIHQNAVAAQLRARPVRRQRHRPASNVQTTASGCQGPPGRPLRTAAAALEMCLPRCRLVPQRPSTEAMPAVRTGASGSLRRPGTSLMAAMAALGKSWMDLSCRTVEATLATAWAGASGSRKTHGSTPPNVVAARDEIDPWDQTVAGQ